MSMIRNPILPGFDPDPSILRVGDDYYIATSTFEWWPGVRIHHSKDLVHWRLLPHPLRRKSQLDLLGNPNSGGAWAPCLSYNAAERLFYLVYTDVKSWWHTYKDTHNYVITSPDIEGSWSEPVYLNSSGFDPSLFHDDDGRKWLVNMLCDFRKGRNPFAGIVLQEYDSNRQMLTGPVKHIFPGTEIGFTEGPHLYKRNGYYYLMMAEGGTWWGHSVTMARSRRIDGPYEADPNNPILTSSGDEELLLQKSGHASVVETQSGDWYMAHLCSRPLMPERRSPLGRETCLQKCVWTDDGWLRLAHGGNRPQLEVDAPALPSRPFDAENARDDFDSPQLGLQWSTLRSPAEESWLSLTERPGYLRLHGRESLSSHHCQSLVARRQDSFYVSAETCLEFEPEHFQQMAGLICFYDVHDYIYLCVTWDEETGKCLRIMHMNSGVYDEPLDKPLPLPPGQRCFLQVEILKRDLAFAWSVDGTSWQRVGSVLALSQLSDEHNKMGFTGNFIGLCAQDLSGARRHADFDYFEYKAVDQ